MESIDFKVSVRCMTYNQSAYIEDAMNGFCMQQTNSPFVCIIMDDASTDGEQEIIKKYLADHFCNEYKTNIRNEETDDYFLTISRHNDNINCYFAVFFLKYNHYGSPELKNKRLKYFSNLESNVDYIAICEGDDYWIDPNKLQRQLDYMEYHKDCSMCFHKVTVQTEQGRKPQKLFGQIEEKNYTKEESNVFLKEWLVPTCSMFLRREYLDKTPKNKNFVFRDSVLVATCLTYGYIHGMKSEMGVYRLTPGGWNGGQSEKKKCYLHISQLKGMREEFPFFVCKTIDNYMLFYYRLLSYILLREINIEEYKKVKQDYSNYFGRPFPNSYSFFLKCVCKDFFKLICCNRL